VDANVVCALCRPRRKCFQVDEMWRVGSHLVEGRGHVQVARARGVEREGRDRGHLEEGASGDGGAQRKQAHLALERFQ